MKPVPLDPGGYTGTYKLIAHEISLDLVNTVSWPGTPREHDWLDRPQNVTAWAVAAGILSEQRQQLMDAASISVLEEQLAAVHEIRHRVQRVLRPIAFDERPDDDAVDGLNELLRGTCAARYLDRATYEWRWADPESLADVLAPVIWNAAHVLTELDHGRIGHCGSCDWIFHDTTRNRTRRWCDMKDCGSRDKALRYYHRTKAIARD